jgi:diguanylate cyclase (GGDEF)-like protein/PAS domain S-box-containing protein
MLVAAVALTVVELVLFLAWLHVPSDTPNVLVLPLMTSATLAFVAAWNARGASQERAARRFWKAIAFGELAGLTGQLLDLPMSMGLRPAAFAWSPLAPLTMFALLIWACYRLPLGAGSRSEHNRLMLDIATVALGALVFVWYFCRTWLTGTMFAGHTGLIGAALVVMAVLALGVVKIILAGSRVIDPMVIRLFGLHVVVAIVGLLSIALVPSRRPDESLEVVFQSAALAVLIGAATRQRRLGRRSTERHALNRARPVSLLPYLAVASVDGLLLLVLWTSNSAQLVVGPVAVVLTGLVIARQIGAFRDNSRLLGELGRQERRFRSLVQNAADVNSICDRNGIITYVSPGVERLTGHRPEDMLGTTGPPVHPDDTAAVTQTFFEVVARLGQSRTVQIRMGHVDGTWRWVEMTLTNLLGDPAVAGIVSNTNDISEAHAFQYRLQHQASHDALTDLGNRSLFDERLSLVLARTDNRPVSLAMLDLDGFKTVNDTLGHHVGDALLVAVAERLRGGSREYDLVARLGGDEFAVLIDNAAATDVKAVVDRMLELLTAPLTIDGHPLQVRASVGIADAQPDDTADELMRRADLALYAAKDAGKGRSMHYTSSMRSKGNLHAESATELRQALSADEFQLYYQPIVTLPERRLAGVEALLRWNHPRRGLVAPLDFIPLAEQTGLIVPIGRWVLAQACRDAAGWLAAYPSTAPASVNVNVSARQLREPGILDDVQAALDAVDLPAHRLVVEVMEDTFEEEAVGRIGDLRALGVRIALDDFGTGQATLSLLDRCAIDELKLDRIFVSDDGPDMVAVAVANIGGAIGADVVAEGIETEAQAERLVQLGYRLGQGFHLGRPVPAAAITEQLRIGRPEAAPNGVPLPVGRAGSA